MSTASIPRFTAQSSLYKTREQYSVAYRAIPAAKGQVQPQGCFYTPGGLLCCDGICWNPHVPRVLQQ